MSIGSQEGDGPLTVESHGGDVEIKLSRQVRQPASQPVRPSASATAAVAAAGSLKGTCLRCGRVEQTGAVTVASGGGNITIKAGSDLYMRLEVQHAAHGAAGSGHHHGGVHIDANHTFRPDETTDGMTTTMAAGALAGHVNYQQTMSEWAEATTDTFQVDVADRFVPKTPDGTPPVLLSLDAGGGRVELLVGGWLDDILSGFAATTASQDVEAAASGDGRQESAGSSGSWGGRKRNPRKPEGGGEDADDVDIKYFGPRNKRGVD